MNLIQRLNLAENPNTSPETLSSLALDTYSWIRSHVAQNPNTPSEALRLLATDTDWIVRHYVGIHPNSTEIIKRLVVMTNHKEDKKSLSSTT
jgi:hypothetical protein